MEITQLQPQLDACTQRVLDLIASAPDDKLFRKPEGGGWSAAEVVEHLVLLDFGIVRILQGTTLPPTRPYDAEVAPMLDALGDPTRTLNAPPPIAPTGRYKDREKMVASFQGVRARLSGWIADHDVTLLYPDFRHALFGELTGYEWIRFVIGHTERHMKQMQRALQ